MYAKAHRTFNENNKVVSVSLEYFSEQEGRTTRVMTESVAPEKFPELAESLRSNGIEVTLVWEKK